MCYTDNLMDGAGAHPPLLLHTIILPVLLCIFYNYILCILITSPQFMVNLWLKYIQYHTGDDKVICHSLFLYNAGYHRYLLIQKQISKNIKFLFLISYHHPRRPAIPLLCIMCLC